MSPFPISRQTAHDVARFHAATDLQTIARTKPLTGTIPAAILTAQSTVSRPEDAMPCGSNSTRWHVVHTNTRAEYRALIDLAGMGFRAYLPMHMHYSRPKKLGEPTRAEVLPLFPRYMFVAFDPLRDQWRRIFSARGVAFLFTTMGEKPVPVPRGVVERIQSKGRAGDGVIDERAEAFPTVTAGETYRVLDGPFAGFEGLCALSEGKRVRLLLDMLGSKREVEFTRGELEKV